MFIGVMSGTSMDAVDVACVDLGHDRPTLIAAANSAWPEQLLQRVRAYADHVPLDATALAMLDADIGEFLASTINNLITEAGLDRAAIEAIGCHGQTVAHSPEGPKAVTLQLGDANIIAERTAITTVNDFRRRDMAAGGQGAPLAPAFHAAHLRDHREDRAVLNLGGIANVTLLPAEPDQDVLGFDTGPANCLMDAWSQRQTGNAFDDAGEWAASGKPDASLLAMLWDDPYFSRPIPKSTGTQYFSSAWLDSRLTLGGEPDAADVQATLLRLTRDSIVASVRAYAPDTARLLVCGGGVHNNYLMQQLGEALQIPVESTADYGIDPDWMEAMAFAWLAQQTLASLPGNLPSVTGAIGSRVLGAIHPA